MRCLHEHISYVLAYDACSLRTPRFERSETLAIENLAEAEVFALYGEESTRTYLAGALRLRQRDTCYSAETPQELYPQA